MCKEGDYNEVVWIVSELMKIMAEDMNIQSYRNEPIESFNYRVIYSALGLWCLKSAQRENENIKGISKNVQSILLNELVDKYVDICPLPRDFFTYKKNSNISVFIRNIYEQTGYLLTLNNNNNILNNTGETVIFSDTDYLYLGLPSSSYSINGLGIHCKCAKSEVKLNDFLIRDELNSEEYLKVNYDECDFEERNIDFSKLDFFNPFCYGNVSNSWNKSLKTNMSIARESIMGPYFRVIKKNDGTILWADENGTGNIDDITGAEFRRIYIALKKHYDNPMQMLICPIDEEYSHIRILGQLPNREYFYLLMNAWPKKGFLDRNNFIIRNELTTQTAKVLKKLGFIIRKGEFYG